MPFRFIVSNKIDYIKANSYINLEDADIIASILPKTGQWGSFDDEKRKIWIISASLGVDGMESFQGYPTNENQVLKFPRNGSFEIPIGLHYAVVKLAVRLSEENEFKDIKREVSDDFEYEYFGNSGINEEFKRDPDVMLFLNRYKRYTVKLKHVY